MRKINYLAIIAGVVALASLVLPWFVGGFDTNGVHMEFTAYLYQITGVVNNVSQTTFVSIWFGWAAIAFLLIAAVNSLTGSLIVGKKGQLLILSAGIFAILSMVVFGAGIVNSDFVSSDLNPRYTISYFPNTFGLTDAQIDDMYDSSWSINYGFWLALVVGIIAFASLITHKNKQVDGIKTNPNTAPINSQTFKGSDFF
jgi:hypothetical protein